MVNLEVVGNDEAVGGDGSGVSYPSNIPDKWEADQTAVAYHGKYAARPGILYEENTSTNLTISLEGLDVSDGGLLTFAVHASVEMPVDALYFTINGDTIRMFESVTGGAGDWEEVSTLLLPGEHVLTWSYQYYGMPADTSGIDKRRFGNSWVDAIALRPFTGDVHFEDDDSSALLDMETGSPSSWSLVDDTVDDTIISAYMGTHSYIAKTNDITPAHGSTTMSWTIIVGPNGGILSFAAFASIYAPHDVLEFSVNGNPEVAITVPSYSWEMKYVELQPGRNDVKWSLVKNFAGLGEGTLSGVGVPLTYAGECLFVSDAMRCDSMFQFQLPVH